jgi:hypothetical protein
MEKVIENLRKENEQLRAMLKETELALKNCVLQNVSPVNISINDWDYHCSDGCCSMYGESISVNGKECDNEYAGGSVTQSLEFVLTELGVNFTINED